MEKEKPEILPVSFDEIEGLPLSEDALQAGVAISLPPGPFRTHDLDGSIIFEPGTRRGAILARMVAELVNSGYIRRPVWHLVGRFLADSQNREFSQAEVQSYVEQNTYWIREDFEAMGFSLLNNREGLCVNAKMKGE